MDEGLNDEKLTLLIIGGPKLNQTNNWRIKLVCYSVYWFTDPIFHHLHFALNRLTSSYKLHVFRGLYLYLDFYFSKLYYIDSEHKRE